MFFGNGITIGKVFGIAIRLDYSWFIIFFLITQSFASQYITQFKFNLTISIILGTITSILIFTSALIHELSHSIVGNRYGANIKRITLFIFGGASELTEEPSSPSVEFKMAVVGPLASFALGFTMWGILLLTQNNKWPIEIIIVAESLRYFNFAVGIFNLLPGFPLDGGRVLRSIIWWKKNDLISATKIASGFGKALGYGLILTGIMLFILGNVFSGIWIAFIGFFLSSAAGISVTQTLTRTILSNIKVSDLMSKKVESVNAETKISTLLDDYFSQKKFSGYPVLKNGKIVGMVYFETLENMDGIDKNNDTSTVTTKLDNKQIVAPQTDASKALKIMSANRLLSLPVLENSKLVGIISQTDIANFLSIKSIASK